MHASTTTHPFIVVDFSCFTIRAHSFNIFMPNYVRGTDWTAINLMECKQCAHLDSRIFVFLFRPTFVLFDAKADDATVRTNCDENNEDDCQINVVVDCRFGRGHRRLSSWPQHFSDVKLFVQRLKNGQLKALRSCTSIKTVLHGRQMKLFIFIAQFKWLMVNSYGSLIFGQNVSVNLIETTTTATSTLVNVTQQQVCSK